MPQVAFSQLRGVDWRGKRVILRAALDVPLKDGVVVQDYRIRQIVPTLQYLLKHQAMVAVMSFLSRPNGKKLKEFSLAPVAKRLSELVGQDVPLVPDCVGSVVAEQLLATQPGQAVMLENTRFHQEEMADDDGFAASLCLGFDLVVFDAFAQSHRAHASTTGILRHLPAAAGLSLMDELKALQSVMTKPKRPAVLVIGGAKVSDKIALIQNLITHVDSVLVGGVAANVFLVAEGKEPLGKSYLSDIKIASPRMAKKHDPLTIARQLLKKYRHKIQLPLDLVAAKDSSGTDAKTVVLADHDINPVWSYFDIGAKTIKQYQQIIRGAKTVLWNGPMGKYETPKFAHGTLAIAKAMAANSGTTIAGGGDSEEIIDRAKLNKKISHVSTGGGAMLELLAGKKLPALEELAKNRHHFAHAPLTPALLAVPFDHRHNPYWRLPLYNLHDLLHPAMVHQFGVPACNIRSKYILDAVLEAAWLEHSPLIIEIAESEMQYCDIPPAKLAAWLVERVPKLEKKYGYSVPLALHADHVKHDVAGVITAAVKAGFSSVLIDQSHLSLEKNIVTVADMVRRLHPLGVSVEGEVGQIGVGLATKKQLVGKAVERAAPTVQQAVEFAANTGIDAFAAFFGNYHGQYQQPATIAWRRMKQIATALRHLAQPVPVVLHGTSFLETSQYNHIEVYHQALRCGCYKFNYSTMLSERLKTHLSKELIDKMMHASGKELEWKKSLGKFAKEIDALPPSVKKLMVLDIREHVRQMMRDAWRSSGKAKHYR